MCAFALILPLFSFSLMSWECAHRRHCQCVTAPFLSLSIFPKKFCCEFLSIPPTSFQEDQFKFTYVGKEILFHIHMKGFRSCRNGYSKLISKLVSNEIHMKFELQVLYVLSALKRIVSSKMICSLTNIVFFKLNIEGNGGLLKQKCSNWLFKTGSF